ncbi:probable inactive nicotinamidase At3g16190 [Cucurbita pepo subsp. pepo]|uniref:probable inactive nicotinamidase At3g16190 n=1 Tax=Cucurbita pepo subsp. pepo TaxID=3664 RepID=UPI000C9D2D1F|nr:probable inactive nicotinamidase At3g16190 [Cucurbita pepo subsp. pepo]
MADQWNHTALLVIDMQKDFIDEGSPFAIPGARAILPSVYRAVEIARKRGVFVIWVVREHDPEGRDVERFRRHYYGNGKLKPAAKGSRGAELVEGLEMKEGEYKLVKTRFSAFFDTNLHSLLQGVGITHLVVAGVQTPNCIRQTVFDAVSLDYHSITLLSDATAAATPKIHQDNITDIKNVGVVASKVDEWGHSDA